MLVTALYDFSDLPGSTRVYIFMLSFSLIKFHDWAFIWHEDNVMMIIYKIAFGVIRFAVIHSHLAAPSFTACHW
jgi:hypothetical protein